MLPTEPLTPTYLFTTCSEGPEEPTGGASGARDPRAGGQMSREGCLGLVPSSSPDAPPASSSVLYLSNGGFCASRPEPLRFTANLGILAYSYFIFMTSASGAWGLWLHPRLEVPRPFFQKPRPIKGRRQDRVVAFEGFQKPKEPVPSLSNLIVLLPALLRAPGNPRASLVAQRLKRLLAM